MSTTRLDLSGFYSENKPTWVTKIPNVSTINEVDHTIEGSGAEDNGEPFVIAGVLIGDDLRYIKQFTGSSSAAWKFVGKRLEPKGNVYQFSGGWGHGNGQYGHWVLSGLGTTLPAKPTHPITGYWQGSYYYNTNQSAHTDGAMNVTISLDDSVPYVAAGPYTISGAGIDGLGGFTLKGTVTKAGDVDIVKAYTAGASQWHYLGKYDGSGTINGTWQAPGTNQTAQGTFKLTQAPVIPTTISQAILPAPDVLFSAPADDRVTAAIQALVAKGHTISAGNLNLLKSGFDMLAI